jgi:MFS family permease
MSAHSTTANRVRPDRKAPRATSRSRLWQTLFDLPAHSRGKISEHRQRRRQLDRKLSDQSRRGLDWTNFFMADVQMGFGAFLAFYLAQFEWTVEKVGLALTIGSLTGVVAQIPGGALADAVRWKRALVGAGVLMIAASAIILALKPNFPFVVIAEILHGATAGIVGPAIAAISLGIAGRSGMSSRVGRNFRFAAAGNALTAAVMGALGAYLSNSAIFYTAAALCIPALLALNHIRPDEIDYARARNAAKRDHSFDLQRVAHLTRNRNLLMLAGGLMVFHFTNASLLPLVGQNLGHSRLALSSLFMAGLIIVPQIVVALLAPWIGYWSELWGRKPLLLIGFAVEALRGLLFGFIADPLLMSIVQLLDGITGAIVTVLTILVITDLTVGTGRFNLAQGMVGTLMGISAGISTTFWGFVAQHFGSAMTFPIMAAVTAAGTALLWLFLPETKPAEYDD